MKQDTEQLKKIEGIKKLVWDSLDDIYHRGHRGATDNITEYYEDIVAKIDELTTPSHDAIKREAVKEFVYYCREKEKSDLVVMAINNKWLMFELENDNTDALKSAVLNEFIKRYEQDHDFCYINYKWFEAEGMKKEQVAPVIKELLKDGVIDYKKGMFTEDGEVFGSGWGIADIEKARTYLTQSKEGGE